MKDKKTHTDGVPCPQRRTCEGARHGCRNNTTQSLLTGLLLPKGCESTEEEIPMVCFVLRGARGLQNTPHRWTLISLSRGKQWSSTGQAGSRRQVILELCLKQPDISVKPFHFNVEKIYKMTLACLIERHRAAVWQNWNQNWGPHVYIHFTRPFNNG